MSRFVDGVSLADIQEQVRPALAGYVEASEGLVQFDVDAALQLSLTPNKPNWARSESIMTTAGRRGAVAKLFVIAFQPNNGTGDASEDRIKYAVGKTAPYPRTSSSIPRRKVETGAEAHLTIATFDENCRPVPFAGCLDLVGITLNERDLVRLGSLGQLPTDYPEYVRNLHSASPTATYTVRRYPNDETFGKEHSVVNTWGYLQVCAFVSVGLREDTFPVDVLRPTLPQDS